MICGLEYYVDIPTKKIRNDSFISLVTRWPGYLSNVISIQPKLEPAYREKIELKYH